MGLNIDLVETMTIPIVIEYSDAGWAGYLMKRKYRSVVFITVNGIPVIWRSKKQSGVALASCKAE